MFAEYTQTIDSLKSRIEAIVSQPLEANEMQIALTTIFNCIDLTTLEGTDNNAKISALCQKALDYAKSPDGNTVAAVCVYMPFVRLAKSLLAGSSVQVATVSCAFPSGQLPLHLKLAETAWVAEEGADDIDMVISRGTLLEGNVDAIKHEVAAVKAACGKAHLKVILETGELQTVEMIRKASEMALLGGADFLKTSTGKINPAATPEAVLIMLDSIKEFYALTGKKVGLKPAGGIVEPETALVYYKLVKSVLGNDWLNSKLFRVGASRLADKVKAML